MSYSHRIELANNIPDDSGEPDDRIIARQQAIILQQSYTIASLQTEVAQLSLGIHELEQEHKRWNAGFVLE